MNCFVFGAKNDVLVSCLLLPIYNSYYMHTSAKISLHILTFHVFLQGVAMVNINEIQTNVNFLSNYYYL